MRVRSVVFALALPAYALAGSGCGGGSLANAPPPNPSEQWVQAGRKVDFAITETKGIIQRARGMAYLPDLYMRLAELYTERARYSWLIAYERSKAHGGESRAIEAPEARLLKNSAISTYTRVIREFPSYAHDDDAMFLMGHEYRELGDFDKMTETYTRLIAAYPKSSHRLEAYLALGDHAFDAADLATATSFYERILSEPASPVHPLARYKLAWVHINEGDCPRAVHLFEETLRGRTDNGASLPEELLRTQKDLNVTRESLVDLAYCYPDVYPDKPPVPYFRDLASSSSDYQAAMRRLAGRFSFKEMHAQSAVVTREILDGYAEDDDAVELVRRLHDSVTRGSLFDRPAEDVGRIIAVLNLRLANYETPPDVGRRLSDEFEIYARDIATRANVAAKDSQSTTALSSVADAYKEYLTRFGKAAAADDIRQNYAETLVAAKRFYEAGQAYEDLLAARKKPENGKQTRLNAISAYQQALESTSLGRLHRLLAWNSVRNIGGRLIEEAPNDPQIVGIKLSIARSYYETGDYESSAHLFYAVARQYPTMNEGVAAANLALDALRLADNFGELATVGGWLVADNRFREDVRKDLREIVSKAAQHQVQEVTASEGDDREEQLLALAKRNKGSEVGEEAFYNTLLLARSSGQVERFFELGDEFLTSYPASARRTDVLGALATVSSDSADFVKEAKYTAAAYAAAPQGKGAVDLLYTAASVHALLGDPAAVSEVAKLSEQGGARVDDLLVLLARSGKMAMLEQVLANGALNSPTAIFFRGYFAFAHNDLATARADFVKRPGVSDDIAARERLLNAEIAYAEYRAVGTKPDLAATVDGNAKALANLDKAYKPVIESGDRWSLNGLARLGDANIQFATLLRNLPLPANLSEQDKASVKHALEAQAAAAEKRGGEFHATCARQAKRSQVFSDAGKSCLLGQPLSDTLSMYKSAPAPAGSSLTGAAAYQKALLKNPKDADALTNLAALHLNAGDFGIALLLLERAEQAGAKKSLVKTLFGLTYYQLNDPQEAGDAFKEAVAADPADPHLHLNLAAHCAAYGEMDRAAAELAKSGSTLNDARGRLDHPAISLLSSLKPKGHP